MLGHKKPLSKSMLGHKLPLGSNVLGHKQPLGEMMSKMASGKPEGEMQKQSKLERRVPKGLGWKLGMYA
jgi:hypothetical protein